jgi:transcriptional regulator with XRE-family HTH domain
MPNVLTQGEGSLEKALRARRRMYQVRVSWARSLFDQGCSNADVANEIGVSMVTVSRYRRTVLESSPVRNPNSTSISGILEGGD